MSPRSPRAAALAIAAALMIAGGSAAQHSTEPIPEPQPFEVQWRSLGGGPSEGWGVDGVDPLHEIGGEWLYEVVTASDPRFDGDVVYRYNNDVYRSLDLQVHHSRFAIETSAGSWLEEPAAMLGHPDLRPSTRTGVFHGAGAYDGLVAVAELTWDPSSMTWDVKGYVVAGGYPPQPGEGARPE